MRPPCFMFHFTSFTIIYSISINFQLFCPKVLFSSEYESYIPATSSFAEPSDGWNENNFFCWFLGRFLFLGLIGISFALVTSDPKPV